MNIPFIGTKAAKISVQDIDDWLRYDQRTFEDYQFVKVSPYVNTDGVEKGYKLMEDFYKSPVDTSGWRTKSVAVPTYAFEIQYNGEEFSFYFGIDRNGTETTINDVVSWVTTRFPDSAIEHVGPKKDEFITVPDMDVGQYCQGGSMTLEQNCIKPIRQDPDDDPFNSFINAMEDRRARTMFQTVFRPASKEWYSQGWRNDASQATEKKTKKEVRGLSNLVEKEVTIPGKAEIEQQEKRPCFHVDVNVLSVADEASVATHRVNEMANMYDGLANPDTQQEIQLRTFGGNLNRRLVRQVLERRVTTTNRLRKAIAGPKRVFTDEELGMLVHLPTRDGKYPVESSSVDYSEMAEGPGVPTSSAQPSLTD